MAQINREVEYRIEEVKNGYIVSTRYNRYVFSTVEEANDFIAKQNQEVFA